jgi:hypothetical protein
MSEALGIDSARSPRHVVHGRLLQVGGPMGARPDPFAGTLVVRGGTDGRVEAVQRVGRDGMFAVEVREGTYLLEATAAVGAQAKQEHRVTLSQRITVAGDINVDVISPRR